VGINLQRVITTRPFDDVAWRKIIAHEIHVRIGNAAPVIGKPAALAELRRFFSRVESVGGGFWELCKRRETIFAEVEVRFIDMAGSDQCIPCVIVARMAGRVLIDLRLGLDPSPIPLRATPKLAT
jgi:hypothetical protein